jgi:predicted nucleic acid-binding protein
LIQEDVDILITGDKDFQEVNLEKPEILTPVDFITKYVKR